VRPGLLVLTLAFVLAGCQGPVTLVVAPEAAELIPSLQTALPAMERQTGVPFVLADSLASSPADALYFSVDSPVPEALASLPMIDHGPGTTALFWDPPGVTVFSEEGSVGTPEGPRSWRDPASGWPKVRRWVIAGAETDLRLAAWLGQSSSDGSLPTTKMFQQFATWATSAPWVEGVWTRKRGDPTPLYRGGQGLAFVETLKDFRRTPGPPGRRFFPLVPDQPPHRPAGSVLSLQAFGGPPAQKAAQAWRTLLTSPDFQKEFSLKTGWTPVPATGVTPTAAVTPAVRDQLQTLLPTLGSLSN